MTQIEKAFGAALKNTCPDNYERSVNALLFGLANENKGEQIPLSDQANEVVTTVIFGKPKPSGYFPPNVGDFLRQVYEEAQAGDTTFEKALVGRIKTAMLELPFGHNDYLSQVFGREGLFLAERLLARWGASYHIGVAGALCSLAPVEPLERDEKYAVAQDAVCLVLDADELPDAYYPLCAVVYDRAVESCGTEEISCEDCLREIRYMLDEKTEVSQEDI